MPTIAVRRRPGGNPGRHPVAALVFDNGLRIELPFAPVEVTHGDWADRWAKLDRSGRPPLLLNAGDNLPTMGCTVQLAHPTSPGAPVENVLTALRAAARAKRRVAFTGMGPQERGAWRLTGVTVASSMRAEGSNHITRAEVQLAFTRASDLAKRTGPLTGGKKKK